jgi:hypothetical protein
VRRHGLDSRALHGVRRRHAARGWGLALVARAVGALPRVVLRELTPSESDFQGRVIGLAKSLGWSVYHTRYSKHSEAGFPDLVLVRPPRLIFAELKVWPRTTPRPVQADWLARLGAVPCVETYLWAWVWPGGVLEEIAVVLAR